MANYANLKAAIDTVIKANGQQEITGTVLNQTLTAMVNSLGAGYLFMGVAIPSTNPGTPDQNVFYLAGQAGTYSNFGAITLQAGLSILKYNGTWSSETLFTLDASITQNSGNPITSGAVFEKLKLDGGAYDVSAHNNNQTFASLSALLSDANLSTLIPTNIRSGGMSIKFIQSSDNKYVQYRLMSDTFNTTPANWQGVDDELARGSHNLIESGAIEKYITPLFDSEKLIEHILSNKKIDIGYNVGTTIEPTPVSEPGMGCGLFAIPSDCKSFRIVGTTGTSSTRLWGFVDADYKLLSVADAETDSRVTVDVPENAAYFIYNSVLDYAGKKIEIISKEDFNISELQNLNIENYKLRTIITPTTDTSNSSQNVFYLAEKGTYNNVGAEPVVVKEGEIGIFRYYKPGNSWGITVFPLSTKVTEMLINVLGISKTALAPLSTTPGSVPTTDGSVISGSSVFDAKDYDIDGLNETIEIKTNTLPSSGFEGVVSYAIYSSNSTPSSDICLAVGSLLNVSGDNYDTIDLSKYPTAKKLRITIRDSNPVYVVNKLTTKYTTSTDVLKLITNTLINEEYLTPKSTTPGSIPTIDGSVMSGGSSFEARDFDVTGLDSLLTINTNVRSTSAGYASAVKWALYSSTGAPDAGGMLAVGPLTSSTDYTSTIDLSQYSTAKLLRVSILKSGASYSVKSTVQKYTTKEKFDALEERVTELEETGVKTMEDGISVVLPDKFIVPVGGRLEIFTRSIIKAVNPYNYHVVIQCAVGKAYPRYYLLEGVSGQAGNTYPFTCSVYRNDGSLIATATTNVMVIAAATSPSSNKNILVIGDSVVAQGYVAVELKRRLTAKSGDADYGDGTPMNPYGKGLNNITFVGRKEGSRVQGTPQEATGGWSWNTFVTQGSTAYRFYVSGVNQLNINDVYTNNGLTFTIKEINITEGSGNIRCTYAGSGTPEASGTLTKSSGNGDATIIYTSVELESANPFWNNGGLDFQNYATLYCNGSIDYLVAFLGINDYGRSITSIVNDIKTLANAYHTAFPAGKFVICTLALPDPTGGMGANYGASATWNYFSDAKYIFDFANAVKELAADANYSGFVVLCPTLQEFDAEYSYPYANAPANNRSAETLHLGQNGVHPTENGQKMISDSMFFTLNDLL